ncbi:hypothetical protein CDL15_Pgr004916 [Punica granatum]|uniref:Uncharacterized protein n=1 Tax=Punica granatum TaxID=22663 RepID=A0A218WPW7_PUNGR|nr:hypothetical protein CDL15_Pgr004916 [Punica granatum]
MASADSFSRASSHVPWKVDTPNPRCIGFAHACPDEIKFGFERFAANGTLASYSVCTSPSLYFPEHPTDEERTFSATSAYVARFYARGLAPPQRSQAAPTPRATSTLAPEAESSIQAAMHAELRAVREERDRLRCELVDSRAEVADYKELRTELTRARARVAHLDREMARLSAELDRVHKRARNHAHS